jgi:cell division protein FtsN
MKFQKGGFALGLVIGLLVGLVLALGVALYITKAPVPFINKVPQRTVEQDKAEAERNKTWDPNAPLAPKVPRPVIAASAPPAAAAAAGSAPAQAPSPAQAAQTPAPAAPAAASAAKATSPARDPAAILSGGAVSTAPGAEPFTYLVQVGAYNQAADAEAQRAKLAIQGFAAKVQEREQAGRTVYRVRLGPFDTRAEAEGVQQKLLATGFEGQMVRVQKP